MTCAFKLITHPTGLFFVAVATARIRQFNQLALLASERCPLNIFETLLQQLRELRGRGLLVRIVIMIAVGRHSEKSFPINLKPLSKMLPDRSVSQSAQLQQCNCTAPTQAARCKHRGMAPSSLAFLESSSRASRNARFITLTPLQQAWPKNFEF